MFLFKKLTFLVIAMLLTLNACGDDNGGDTGGDSDQTLTGVFIDSPVAGLEYSIGTLSGITNEAGEFTYPKDTTDKISFYIGNLVIGSATPASIVTPLDFGLDLSDVTDYQTLVLILLTLQTIDSDDDPY
jgi:hypothetical protein